MSIRLNIVLLLLCTGVIACYGQSNDSAKKYIKAALDTPKIGTFEQVSIFFVDTNSLVIRIKGDSILISRHGSYFFTPIKSLQELDSVIKDVLKERENASFEIRSYVEMKSSYKNYEKVVAVLKKNKIYHFTNSLPQLGAP
jgi:hypothetical protein